MRDELANVVYPIITHGLRLKERLEHGEEPDLHTEQTDLKKLLRSESEARRWPDYGGSGSPLDSMAGQSRQGGGDRFLGSRYALVCWLDEIIILDSPWNAVWNEQKLEEALYGQNERAYKFWEQARIAEARMEADALEVYYLCVMLGFRGDLREKPDKLRVWRDAVEGAIGKHQQQKWPGPQEITPATNVPPLRGREQLRKVMLAIGVLIGLLVPVAAFYVVYQFGK
jgi:type VI secretion system protein ImpK